MCYYCELEYGETRILKSDGRSYAWFIEHINKDQYTLNVLDQLHNSLNILEIQTCCVCGRNLKDE